MSVKVINESKFGNIRDIVIEILERRDGTGRYDYYPNKDLDDVIDVSFNGDIDIIMALHCRNYDESVISYDSDNSMSDFDISPSDFADKIEDIYRVSRDLQEIFDEFVDIIENTDFDEYEKD